MLTYLPTRIPISFHIQFHSKRATRKKNGKMKGENDTLDIEKALTAHTIGRYCSSVCGTDLYDTSIRNGL